MQSTITISLPNWIQQYVNSFTETLDTTEKKMKFVLGLARENITNKTGGPFSAAIFDMNTNQLISCGVNRVVPESCSTAHAEVMAIMFAQKKLNTFDFSLKGRYQLITSAKMCIMCLGNVIWSGISEVAYSADTNDVQQITGFDQGPVPKQYNQQLSLRGINVIPQLLNAEGRKVLQLYANNNGYIYNSKINKLSVK